MVAMPYSETCMADVLDLARQSLLASFGLAAEPGEPEALSGPGCCFVTLTINGGLRGCIGSLEPRHSLAKDVIENSRNAAFSDPRFPSLREAELDRLMLEVSILGPHSEITVASEKALIKTLVPGVDGLVLTYDGMRATFLPSVWEQLPEPSEFLQALKRKAGLPENFWSAEMRWYRYSVQKVSGRVL